MDTSQILVLIILSSVICGLAVTLLQEKKKSKILQRQLDSLGAQTDDEIYGKGKFSELGLLSAGITHEISSPLTIILTRTTKLLRSDLSKISPEDLERGIEQIKTNSERIAKIVESVREYIYRNEENVEDFISLQEIMDNVLVFYGQRLKNHGIELRMKNTEKVFIKGEKGRYEQAFLNLMSNSFDAIDQLPEKWIEISAKQSLDNVQIFFRDSGSGIPIDVQEKMLDPFYSTKKGKGMGLGLTLVKEIAQKNGGDFQYLADQNTTFLLELPRATAENYHY